MEHFTYRVGQVLIISALIDQINFGLEDILDFLLLSAQIWLCEFINT